MDKEFLDQLLQLPKDSGERRAILALMDCHFMSTAMLRISQTPADQQVVLQRRITEIIEHTSAQSH